MNESLSFAVELEQLRDYEFPVRFDWPGVEDLLLDEPEPLGHSRNERGRIRIAAAK